MVSVTAFKRYVTMKGLMKVCVVKGWNSGNITMILNHNNIIFIPLACQFFSWIFSLLSSLESTRVEFLQAETESPLTQHLWRLDPDKFPVKKKKWCPYFKLTPNHNLKGVWLWYSEKQILSQNDLEFERKFNIIIVEQKGCTLASCSQTIHFCSWMATKY